MILRIWLQLSRLVQNQLMVLYSVALEPLSSNLFVFVGSRGKEADVVTEIVKFVDSFDRGSYWSRILHSFLSFFIPDVLAYRSVNVNQEYFLQ
jgi:hypothetical protein